ncbi:MAG: hypothetical protein HYZ23_02365 [Chloroflexi bacterium]|nr:hypothetical protein [Chloroflexota bacterium]
MTGVFLRLIVPLGLTALIVFWLRRLDVRWQAEAEKERTALAKDSAPCWKEQGLSVDEIQLRAEKDGKPCWQTHRLSNGYLREACLDCEVFLAAPVPAVAHSNAHA